jgi:polysaccharide export outer membrane protein
MGRILNVSLIGLLIILLGIPIGCAKEGLRQPTFEEQRVTGSDQYIIGPEDLLRIDVWKEPSLSGNVPVRMDGKISLPLIDDVQAAGLTALQLKENLGEKLKEYVDSPNVSVTVVEANSFRVFVSGQVKTPGVFKLRTETTLIQVISMAGGFTDWANPKKILIIRKEKNGEEKRFTGNYKEMIDGRAPAFILKPGDTVIVP